MADAATLRAASNPGTLALITPLVITYNEEPNIARVLERLAWAQRIVVIDSGSTDRTLELLSANPAVEIVHRNFDTFASQCNFGLQQVRTPWVLSLDADYVLSEALVAELGRLSLGSDGPSGYTARFRYVIHGRALRGTLYPPRTILYRVDRAAYRDEGHGHRVEVSGSVAKLAAPVLHDDRKSLARWFASQQRYAAREAAYLLSTQPRKLRRQDRLRLLAWPAPVVVFLYTLFVRGCILDGWRGWFYALQRLLAECMLALELIDRRLSESPGARR